MDLPEKALKAKQRGEKEIPKFKDWFPHGENYEVFRVGFWSQLAKCDLSEPYLRYIAHNRHQELFGTFAELDIPLEPHWAFIYHRNAKFFSFAPMTLNQEAALDALNQDFYKAWLLTKKGKFNPKKSLFMPIHFVRENLFQANIKPCLDLCHTAWNTIRESSDLAGVRPIVMKVNKRINRYRVDISLEQEFEVLLERATFLSNMINEGLRWAVQFFKSGASKKKIFASRVLGVPPPARIGIPQIYLFPSGKKSVLINLSVHTGSGAHIRLFETFGSTYDLIKSLYTGFSQ